MASARVFAFGFLALLVIATFHSALARPEGGDIVAMADAIKYLQELDKMYGQAARPSAGAVPGSSALTPPTTSTPLLLDDPNTFWAQVKLWSWSELSKAMRLLHLQELDRTYAIKVRPRFGKRGYPLRSNSEQQEDSNIWS